MTVIHTAADLIRLLEENEEFRLAVRRHILTDELMRLPEQFAKFVAGQQKFNRKVDQRFDKIDRRFDKIDRRIDKIDRRIDKIDADQQQFRQQMETFVAGQQKFNRQIDQRLDRIDQNMGQIKAGHALMSVERNATLIAHLLDFEWQRTLQQHELLPIIRTLQLSRNERISFLQADLIMVATDPGGTDHCVAVEVSFTADRRDTDRAIRNADFLQQGTGLPATPVIASVHNDRATQSLVDSGKIRWLEITESMTEVR